MAEETTEKKAGFFSRAWETTKRIALTPVDPWFEAVAKGLDRTRQGLVDQVVSLFKSKNKIDEELWEELEDILITSDVGTEATDHILKKLRDAVREKTVVTPPQLYDALKVTMADILGTEEHQPLDIQEGRVNVILMVGVNGSGKTTTTAKLAQQFKNEGKKVLLGAADTFRAAAIEQLDVWAKRIGVDLIKHNEGSDPAAVVFDAVSAAKARNVDVLIIDTAGRLQSKANLMEELKKMRRICERELPGSPHEVLLVLDATTGQNAVSQAKLFHQASALTGLVLCKLDGTAKGGIVIAVGQEFKIPVKFIGVGEAIEDLRPFRAASFLSALFGDATLSEEAPASEGA